MYMAFGTTKPGCTATTFDGLTTWNDANGGAFLTLGAGGQWSSNTPASLRPPAPPPVWNSGQLLFWPRAAQ